jgi:hypothetical protein
MAGQAFGKVKLGTEDSGPSSKGNSETKGGGISDVTPRPDIPDYSGLADLLKPGSSTTPDSTLRHERLAVSPELAALIADWRKRLEAGEIVSVPLNSPKDTGPFTLTHSDARIRQNFPENPFKQTEEPGVRITITPALLDGIKWLGEGLNGQDKGTPVRVESGNLTTFGTAPRPPFELNSTEKKK